jgi:Cu/Zn superoxide dismutase
MRVAVAVVVLVLGLPALAAADGLRAVHIREVGNCEPCAAADGHHDPGPYGARDACGVLRLVD